MALVPVVGPADGSLVELEDIGSSAESLGRVLESQKSLFHSQAEQLQKLVVTQCKLTGVNPLSQEMAAGALSIKIGKKPKDLLNPKAIKYMQSIFSIKDTIGKKETREISALCGITVTQVRDYFSGQRSRVRKLVNLSREKATGPEVSRAVSDGCYSSPDQTLLESTEASTNTVDLRIVGECAQVPGNMENITAAYTQVTGHSGNAATQPLLDPGNAPAQLPMNSGNLTTVCTQVVGSSDNVAPVCTQVVGHSGNVATVYTQVPVNLWIISPFGTQVPGNLGSFGIVTPQNSADVATVCAHSGVVAVVQEGQQSQVKTDLKTVEGGPSNSLKEETTPGVDSDDKRFLENIFNLMRKEQTFSGQMKLMEWVLQIHNSAVLNWFSTKGGITILALWLSQAALEEQTTVLLILFKVLCHLPLHKALPAQMSAILQTVNRLRFYRTSDISNRARKLLSRWSKMFVRSQSLRNPSRNPSKNTQEIIRKDRISEILGDESWQSKIDFPEEILALAGSADDSRKSEPKQALKLLESSDGATKKHGRNVSSSKAKERRKVLLVEHPDQKMGGRSVPVARAAPSNHSRPMSADDIQKAKMRAIFMQSKYGKPGTSAIANSQQKSEEPKVTSSSQASSVLPANRAVTQLPQPRRAEVKIPPKDSPHKIDTPTDPKRNMTSPEQSLEKLIEGQLHWHAPAEIRINSSWTVGVGENSKEVQIQTQRNQREKETFYSNPQDIPPNPKEPWDIEMDFDDSLTPEIPIEQAPELDSPASTAAAADVEGVGSLTSPRDGRVAASEGTPACTSTMATVVAVPSPSTTSNGLTEPDLELLAVLLKNPDVVFALTSGQGKSLTNEEMVALLDLVKRTGVGLADIANGFANIPKEKPPVPALVPVSAPMPVPEQTSLPSPTPPSNATRVGWRSEFPSSHAQIPQLQPQSSVNRGDTIVPTISPPTPTANPMAMNHQAQSLGLLQQVPTTMLSLPQMTVTVNHRMPQQHPQQHQPVPPNLLPLKPHSAYAPPHSQTPNPEIMLHSNHRYQANDPSFPMFPPTPQNPQSHILLETMTYPPNKIPAWPHSATVAASAALVGRQTLVPDSRTGRPNELLDVPMYLANNNNYNSSNIYPRRNEYFNGSEMEGSRSPEFYRNVLEPRREFGRSQQSEWARQGNSGLPDQYRSGGGGKRWRDWDRDRDRDRRR